MGKKIILPFHIDLFSLDFYSLFINVFSKSHHLIKVFGTNAVGFYNFLQIY